AMRDELGEHELSEQLRRQAEPTFAVPPRRERRIDASDLRAHETHPPAVEAAAEVERHGLLPVPGTDDHGALRGDAVDRLLQGGGTPARVDGDVGATATGESAHEILVGLRDRGLRAAAP